MEEMSEIYGTLCFKRNDESLRVTMIVSLKTETDTKSQEIPGSSQKSCVKKSAGWS